MYFRLDNLVKFNYLFIPFLLPLPLPLRPLHLVPLLLRLAPPHLVPLLLLTPLTLPQYPFFMFHPSLVDQQQ